MRFTGENAREESKEEAKEGWEMGMEGRKEDGQLYIAVQF